MSVQDILPPIDGWQPIVLDKTGVPHSYQDKCSMVRGSYQKAWTYRGEFHRVDKPAVIFGEKEYYYTMGVLHRIDGPAIHHIFKSGYAHKWYMYGLESNEENVSTLKQVSQDKGIPCYLAYLMNKIDNFDTNDFKDNDYQKLIEVPLTMISDVLHLDRENKILTDDFVKVASFERKEWLKER
jgi:hypothetical protein